MVMEERIERQRMGREEEEGEGKGEKEEKGIADDGDDGNGVSRRS